MDVNGWMDFYYRVLDKVGHTCAAGFFSQLGRSLGCKLPSDPYTVSVEARTQYK